MKKIFCVFGTRPEAIKISPILKILKKEKDKFNLKVCVTAQHREMLDPYLKFFGITPHYDLNIMEDRQSLEQLSHNVLSRIPSILKKESPDLTLVQGDTSTAFLAALSSFYLKIPVAHVEAGLRTYNYSQPFPEEANRRLIDALSILHFAPTLQSKTNLLKEGFSAKTIFVTGNSGIDALKSVTQNPQNFQNPFLKNFFNSNSKKENFKTILVTAHRRENFGKPLKELCLALKSIADSFPEVFIFYPVHLNPNVGSVVKKILKNQAKIFLLPPLEYGDFTHLLKKSWALVTDSGGLQEEAPTLGIPTLVLRKITERPEAVQTGSVKVIGTEKENIIAEVSKLIKNKNSYQKMAKVSHPYGDGGAAQRIVNALLFYFNYRKNRPKDFEP
ncbi:MAG: UDP-N-acetylglucosamine 2-epimerase (non-hydrolyzing) [Elusimicrobia bacterium]|nr:UDP-N-acetylglucosamine 2-epimerase (non-hydrolyzing) [Elusimicrobiota bacterium]